MIELTLRGGHYYVGDRVVNRVADSAGYFVFFDVPDCNEVEDGAAISKGAIHFVDDNMDIKFSVCFDGEVHQGWLMADAVVIDYE